MKYTQKGQNMKYTQKEVNEINNKTIRRERGVASILMLFCFALGMLAERCSNATETRDVKSGVVMSDSAKSFQPGDTIKVILINEKQR